MTAPEIEQLYDRSHASSYDERFLTGEEWSKQGSDFELEVLATLVDRPDAGWLDVACGTGYYLGQFPNVERVGLDLSSEMLRVAEGAAPGVQFEQGSYLEEHPEWENRWSVVSCMWSAYSYVDSLAQVENLMGNLARWTAVDGSLFLPVCDVADLAGGVDVAYRNADTWIFGGPLLVKAVVWDWHDEKLDKHHRNLIAPHLDHFVEVLGRFFGRIEVVRYPPYMPGWDTRKAIVASEKRELGDGDPAIVVRHAPPPCRTDLPVEASPAAATEEAVETSPSESPETHDTSTVGDPSAPQAGSQPFEEAVEEEEEVTYEPTEPPEQAGPWEIMRRARPHRRQWWTSVGHRGRRQLLSAVRAAERRLDG